MREAMLAPLAPADSQGLFLAQRCGQITQGRFERVLSSDGTKSYSVAVFQDGADCTCPGHKFHGKCKHVAAVRDKVCSWQTSQGEDQSLEQNVRCVCPACNSETELVA